MGVMFSANGDSNQVDFIKMSKDLQLHYSSLNYVSSRASKVNKVKEIMAVNGKTTDLKSLNTAELRKMIQGYQ